MEANRFSALNSEQEPGFSRSSGPRLSSIETISRRAEFEEMIGGSLQQPTNRSTESTHTSESVDEPSDADETTESSMTDADDEAQQRSWTGKIADAVDNFAHTVLPQQVFTAASEVANGNVLDGARRLVLGKPNQEELGAKKSPLIDLAGAQKLRSSARLRASGGDYSPSSSPDLSSLRVSDKPSVFKQLQQKHMSAAAAVVRPGVVMAQERPGGFSSASADQWQSTGRTGKATTADDRLRGEPLSDKAPSSGSQHTQWASAM